MSHRPRSSPAGPWLRHIWSPASFCTRGRQHIILEEEVCLNAGRLKCRLSWYPGAFSLDPSPVFGDGAGGMCGPGAAGSTPEPMGNQLQLHSLLRNGPKQRRSGHPQPGNPLNRQSCGIPACRLRRESKAQPLQIPHFAERGTKKRDLLKL